MIDSNKIYKCGICGNIVSAVYNGGGDIICCGQEMNEMEVKTQTQEGKEKHVPVIEEEDGLIKVKVGSVLHPQTDEHYIQLIQLFDGDILVKTKRLYPNQEPIAVFKDEGFNDINAKELCNLHGIWTS